MHKVLVLLIASLLTGVLLLSTSAAQAAALAPELRQRMETAGPGDKVPVIIHFTDRLDVKTFAQRSNRAAARAGMVRGLRDQARRSQGPLQGFLRRQGVEPTELWLINALAVQVPPLLIETLAAWPGVAAVELDGEVPPPAPVTLAAPAEPTDNLKAIGVEPLWAAGITGRGVVVASFDSGVDVSHPDLESRWRGGTNSWFDPYGDSAIPYDVARDRHGTAVTSLMVGGVGSGNTIGVAPDARWIAAKIFPDDGSPASNSNIHLAFQWAIDPDGNPDTDDAPDIVNNSWGFEKAQNQCITSDFFRSDVQALQAAGIHVVFSAGNGGPVPETSVSPANYPEGLAVGSIAPDYKLSSFSALGPNACSGSIYNDLADDVYPELVAPGELVTVAYTSGVSPPGYAIASGTSFSAPHVSGALALLRSVIPPHVGESMADYRLRLELGLLATTADLGPIGADNSYGRGLVDLPAAYDRLRLPPPAQLVAPGNTAVGLSVPVNFSWIQGEDLDGDELTHILLIDSHPFDFAPAERTILVLTTGTSGVLIAGLGFFRWPRSGKRRPYLLIAGVLFVLWLMVACGGGGGGTTIVATDSIVVNDLSSATTYYWKVQTRDIHGGVSESEVWSFTTR